MLNENGKSAASGQGRQPRPMMCRGVRGAITVAQNSPEAISKGTKEILAALIAQNGIDPEDIGSIYFTTTRDLNTGFPATAARELGLTYVPLLCGNEIDVPESLPRCIRVLLHWNTTKTQREIQHLFLGEAAVLRPDISNHDEALVRPLQMDWMKAAARMLAQDET